MARCRATSCGRDRARERERESDMCVRACACCAVGSDARRACDPWPAAASAYCPPRRVLLCEHGEGGRRRVKGPPSDRARSFVQCVAHGGVGGVTLSLTSLSGVPSLCVTAGLSLLGGGVGQPQHRRRRRRRRERHIAWVMMEGGRGVFRAAIQLLLRAACNPRKAGGRAGSKQHPINHHCHGPSIPASACMRA